MIPSLRRLLVVAVAGGVLVGGGEALLADRAPAPAAVPTVALDATTGRGAQQGLSREETIAPARDVRLAAREPDPGGGPPWALRTFTASGREGEGLVCAQVGRLVDGRFGWIAPGESFRPADFTALDAPLQCQSPDLLGEIGASVVGSTLVTDPRRGSPRPARALVWGLVERGVRTVAVQVPGKGRRELSPTARGGFLAVGPGAAGPARTVRGELRYEDGSTRSLPEPDLPEPPGPRPVPGSVRVGARAPDPGGGPPWGVLVGRTEDGRRCISDAGRLVGTRFGRVDELGLFQADPFGPGLVCGDRRAPTRRRPAALQTLVSSISEADPRGRIERRVLAGRTVLSGRVHPDVEWVTIATPRDVRRLRPSGPAHAVIAAYDGTFPVGEILVTSRFDDGSVTTQRVETGA